MIPVRGRSGSLRGVLRYAPRHDHAPKMLAVAGTRLGLVPHPGAMPAGWTLVVEGPPDMISARSRGLRAVGVAGDHAWEAGWPGCSLAGVCRWSWTVTARAARLHGGSLAFLTRLARLRV
jgi:hypothetical protein